MTVTDARVGYNAAGASGPGPGVPVVPVTSSSGSGSWTAGAAPAAAARRRVWPTVTEAVAFDSELSPGYSRESCSDRKLPQC